MFGFTTKIFFIVLDILCSAILAGLAFVALAFILFIVITAVKAMSDATKDKQDSDTYFR